MFPEHHGIDDQRTGEASARDRLDDCSRPESSRLDRLRRQVFEDRVELLPDEIRVQVIDPGGAHRVLHGYQRDNSSSVDIEGLEGLQVSLKTCATAGVRTGYGEGD